MFSREGRRLAAILSVLVIAACGPVPKPFKQTDSQKIEIDLVRPEQSRSLIIVVPVLDDAAATDRLGASVHKAFEAAGIPTTTNTDHPDAPLLIGSAWRTGDGLRLRWELFGSDSDLKAASVVEAAPPASAWIADDSVSEDIARKVVDDILPALRPAAGRLDPLEDPSVFVETATGAPGDGNQALERAAIAALDRAGVRRTDDRESANVFLRAVVKVVSVDDETDAVRIRWLIEDSDGAPLGTMTQQTLVASGSLQNRWGLAAYDAAEAIAGPVGDVLSSLDPATPAEESANP
ncbi:MAG: hypothetical protein RIM72_22590 [Alphaproteobacteria bacterium]